jgi:hypothetical protein
LRFGSDGQLRTPGGLDPPINNQVSSSTTSLS